jgi:hypothetical protein
MPCPAKDQGGPNMPVSSVGPKQRAAIGPIAARLPARHLSKIECTAQNRHEILIAISMLEHACKPSYLALTYKETYRLQSQIKEI